MIKIVRGAGGLLAIILIGMTGSLWMVRHQNEPQAVMLVVVGNNIGRAGDSRAYLVAPGTRHYQAIAHDFNNIDGRGWAGGWFYLIFLDNAGLVAEIWRLSEDGSKVEHLPAMKFPAGSATWTPDGAWLVYTERENDVGAYDVYRRRADGTGVENLTADFVPSAVPASNAPLLSGDGQWVIFSATPEMDAYRMPIEGGDPENLTPELDGPATVRVYPAERAWLVVEVGGIVYRAGQDGTNPQRVLSGGQIWNREEVVMWLPHAEILLVRRDDASQAMLFIVSTQTWQVLWQGANRGFVATPDERWLLRLEGNSLYRMRPDGTDFAEVATLPIGIHPQMSVVGAWLYLKTSDIHQQLSRIHLENGTLQLIRSNLQNVELKAWSPDEAWLWVEMDDANGQSRPYWMRADGSESRRLTPLREADFLTWLPPLNRAWSPEILLIGGLGLVGAIILRRVAG